MNLYKFHDNPGKLPGYKDRRHVVPKLIQQSIRSGEPVSKKQLHVIANNSMLAYWYAKKIVKKRWPPGEKIIAADVKYAFDYADDVVGGSWPMGEKIIATDVGDAINYAILIDKRWPLGEKIIATDAQASFEYAKNIIGGQWPPGEKSIATDAGQSYLYAKNVVKGKWPPGEKIIATSNYYVTLYNIMLGVKGYSDNDLLTINDKKAITTNELI